MLHQPDLYSAILANPEDDAPRLIYADWLEENGEEERAKFIRAQISIARNEGSVNVHLKTEASYWAKFRRVHTTSVNPLIRINPLEELRDFTATLIKRGFEDAICIDYAPVFRGVVKKILDQLPSLPVQSLQCINAARHDFRHVLAHSSISRIRHLHIMPRMDSVALCSLLRNTPLQHLRTLSILNTEFDDDNLRELSGIHSIQNLTRLNVSCCHIVNGLTDLVFSRSWPHLQEICVRSNSIDNLLDLDKIAEMRPLLRIIDLQNNRMRDCLLPTEGEMEECNVRVLSTKQ
jgi:uncharacterized protein (TIGR02996 family)